MKPIYKILLALLIIVSLSSCEDALKENPKGRLYPSELLSTAELAQSNINSLYGIFVAGTRGSLSGVMTHGITPASQRYITYLTDVPGEDIWVSNTNNVARTSIDMFTYSNNGNDNIDRMYYSFYQAIKDCNFSINGLNNRLLDADPMFKGDTAQAEQFRKRCLGQALAIRAYVYFYAVRLFGDAVVVPEELIIDNNMMLKRQNFATIYRDVIIPDLRLAIDYLGDMPAGSSGFSRITANAAKAILAEVYLTIAGRVYDKGISTAFSSETFKTKQDFYSECVRLCAELDGQYSLYPNFAKLFTVDGNFSTESVFEVQTETNQFAWETMPEKIADNTSGLYPYTAADGTIQTISGYGRYCMADVLYNQYDQKYDKRLENVVAVKNTYISGVEIDTHRSLKYCDSTTMSRQKYSPGDSRVAWKVIRYATVLLMRAEALNEMGKTTEAAPFLLEVRKRAYRGNEDKIEPAPTDQNAFRQAVWLERRKELYGEQYRYFDMQRTNTLYLASTEPAGARHDLFPVVEEKHYLFPLPKIAFEYNPNLGDQNPGWTK